MRLAQLVTILLAVCLTAPAGAQLVVTGGAGRPPPESLNVPRIVQIPTDDFVWHWGRKADIQEPDSDQFEFEGTEERFFCQLTGSSDRMGPVAMSDLEHSLTSTQYFIQDATARMNDIFRGGGNSENWATLRCVIPDGAPSAEREQELIDEARQRAERQRERRRARDAEEE